MPRRLIGFIQRAKAPKRKLKPFRHRYTAMEVRRAELTKRLAALGERAKEFPAYKTTLTLLNETFRRGSLTQRVAILQAASWLIDVLERMTTAV